jgi:hypothetical protein
VELRTFVTFEADFPDDGEFTESGDVKRPGGLNIALALGEMLQRQGFELSKPQQHSFYGWEFTVSAEGFNFRLLLQFPGPWLLLSQDKNSFLRGFLGSKALVHRRVLETLNRSLAQSSSFRVLRWYSKEEYESGKGST